MAELKFKEGRKKERFSVVLPATVKGARKVVIQKSVGEITPEDVEQIIKAGKVHTLIDLVENPEALEAKEDKKGPAPIAPKPKTQEG